MFYHHILVLVLDIGVEAYDLWPMTSKVSSYNVEAWIAKIESFGQFSSETLYELLSSTVELDVTKVIC